MHIKFNVNQLLEEGSECSLLGTVTVDVPSYAERQTFILRAGYSEYKSEKGEDDDSKLRNASKLLEINGRAATEVLGRVVECDLKNEDGSLVIKTNEEFGCHPEATELVEGLMAKFLSNFAAKKKKPSPSSK